MKTRENKLSKSMACISYMRRIRILKIVQPPNPRIYVTTNDHSIFKCNNDTFMRYAKR